MDGIYQAYTGHIPKLGVPDVTNLSESCVGFFGPGPKCCGLFRSKMLKFISKADRDAQAGGGGGQGCAGGL